MIKTFRYKRKSRNFFTLMIIFFVCERESESFNNLLTNINSNYSMDFRNCYCSYAD